MRSIGTFYAGAVALALAVYAPRIARRSFAMPFFALLAAGSFVLTLPTTTPLHALLYLVLPAFENMHRHAPERIILAFLFASALLAGAAVSALRRLPVVPVALIVLVLVDLLTFAPVALLGGGLKVDPDAFYRPTGAAAFLRAQQSEGPSRFFGYDPAHFTLTDGVPLLYVLSWWNPDANALLVTNRATVYGVQDVQGYNPLQPARYTEFIAALNGYPQDYHGTNVLAEGFDSPLLDLLGARYVVVPAGVPAGRPDLLHLSQGWPTVYQDDMVRVLENREALPRAWLVHEARQVEEGEALGLLATGGVDPRRVTLLEDTPPVLGIPADPRRDAATITHYEPDRIVVYTTYTAASLLVLSESYDPNWRAYVDGERVEVFVADHALRAVAVAAGEHEVEWRYESTTLRTGLAISGGALVLLGGVWGAAGLAWVRRRGDQNGQ